MYRNDDNPVFGENLAQDRGEEFINMLVSDAQFLEDTSFGIEAEAIGAI